MTLYTLYELNNDGLNIDEITLPFSANQRLIIIIQLYANTNLKISTLLDYTSQRPSERYR